MDFSYSGWKDYPDTGRSTGEYIISIKVGQLTMAKMFQDQLKNPVQKVNTMQHALQEWI